MKDDLFARFRRNLDLMGLALLSLFTVGSIIFANVVGSKSSTQKHWTVQPDLYVCDTAPAWAQPGSPALDKALVFWAENGWSFAQVQHGPCATLCSVQVGGETLSKNCMPGKIVLDLADSSSTAWHFGKCSLPQHKELLAQDSGSITVPSVILSPDDPNDRRILPKDAEARTLAHEIGHCLVGVGHNEGPEMIKGWLRVNPKTGTLMNPSLYEGGWDLEGVNAIPAWK